MAITFLQSAGINGSSGTTLAKIYGSNLTSGSYLLAFVLSLKSGNTAPTVTIADNHSNVWTRKVFHDFGGTASKVYIFGAPNTAGVVANTVTATFSAAVTLSILGILEYSGVYNNDPIDNTADFLDRTGTSPYTGNSVTTTRLNDVVLGFGYNGLGGPGTTAGTGQTIRLQGSNAIACLGLDRPAATLGTYTPSCTYAGTVEYALATIALASVIRAGSPNLLMMMGVGT